MINLRRSVLTPITGIKNLNFGLTSLENSVKYSIKQKEALCA